MVLVATITVYSHFWSSWIKQSTSNHRPILL